MQLGWGVAVMVLTQVQGYLPSLDFLDPKTLKLISFAFGVGLTCAKGAELFFQKAADLFFKGEISTDPPTTTPP